MCSPGLIGFLWNVATRLDCLLWNVATRLDCLCVIFAKNTHKITTRGCARTPMGARTPWGGPVYPKMVYFSLFLAKIGVFLAKSVYFRLFLAKISVFLAKISVLLDFQQNPGFWPPGWCMGIPAGYLGQGQIMGGSQKCHFYSIFWPDFDHFLTPFSDPDFRHPHPLFRRPLYMHRFRPDWKLVPKWCISGCQNRVKNGDFWRF